MCPKLVRIFSANLVVVDDKLSYYVMHKYLVIDSKVFGKEFDMDLTPLKLTVRFFPNYSKDLGINLLFPYTTQKDVSEKLMLIS